MRTKLLLVSLVTTAALLAVPVVSSAATIAELQAQLAALLSQIQTLQHGATSSPVAVSGSASLSGNVVSSLCPMINRSLTIGSRGTDVSALQTFLQQQGYLNVSATGYFGALTRAAVGKWQESAGVTTSGHAGWGVFGPMSRSSFARLCGGNGNGNGSTGGTTSQYFSADPHSGPAPLTVTFSTNDSINASSTKYSVDFGDGTSDAQMAKGSCVGITAIVGGQGGIRCSFSLQHTYSANGTYTAKLLKQTVFKCPAGLMCAQTASSAFMLPAPQTVATTVITVGSSTTGTLNFSASPTSGAAPLQVQFTATAPQGTTLGNFVTFGDGATGTLMMVPVCSSCSLQGIVSHTYASAGTYTATLTNNLCSCPATGICNCPNIPILGTATITVSGTTTNPNITRINAPASVSLGVNDIAEVRNEHYYFALNSLATSSATIQLTQVGCWNSFPSDTPPQIRCMIAVVPIPPVTLTLNQSYMQGYFAIQLTNIANGRATFLISAPTSTSPTVY